MDNHRTIHGEQRSIPVKHFVVTELRNTVSGIVLGSTSYLLEFVDSLFVVC